MHDETTFPQTISFHPALPTDQFYTPSPERLISGDPKQSVANVFTSSDGRFNAGIWHCTPGKWRVIFTESEFCHLLEGVIVVTGDDGSEATYRAGDAFVTPAGFTGTWDVREYAKKYYAVYE